jgi:hypothetical protein
MVGCHRIGGHFAGRVFHLHQPSLEAGQTRGIRVSFCFQEVKSDRYLSAIQCQFLFLKEKGSEPEVQLSSGYNYCLEEERENG